MTSRLTTVITLIIAFVGCVAAVVVVPEVRCALGLPTETTCARHRSAAGLSSSLLPEERGLETAIGRIRAVYDRVERERTAGQYDSLRKDITGTDADSAYATIYLSRGAVPEIRERIYHGAVRTSVLMYFDAGELVFVHRASSRMPGTGDDAFDQQRFYFADGALIQWLRGADKRKVPSGTPEYETWERNMGALGTRLLEGARSPEPVIEL